MPDWNIVTVCPEHQYCSAYLPPYDGTIQDVWVMQIPEFPWDGFHLPVHMPYEWLMQLEPDPNVPMPRINPYEANFELDKFLDRVWLYDDDEVPDGCSKYGPDKFDPNWKPWCEKRKDRHEGLMKRSEPVTTTLATITKATKATSTPVPKNHENRNLRAQAEDFDTAGYQLGDFTQFEGESILPTDMESWELVDPESEVDELFPPTYEESGELNEITPSEVDEVMDELIDGAAPSVNDELIDDTVDSSIDPDAAEESTDSDSFISEPIDGAATPISVESSDEDTSSADAEPIDDTADSSISPDAPEKSAGSDPSIYEPIDGDAPHVTVDGSSLTDEEFQGDGRESFYSWYYDNLLGDGDVLAVKRRDLVEGYNAWLSLCNEVGYCECMKTSEWRRNLE
ncbi:Protein of unknown function [Pyronema omphalodes CBS 100304]|uniref:Uncharacterized protein n=1 Tax=Pyronema omphalodes (strain CBS 100304) TaxID=1076935 RepID=U4KY58_PYROM|nr:Protein of unknown function [Pyronema omphalodes CBS 100304]